MSVQSISGIIAPPSGLRVTGGNIVGTLVSAQNLVITAGGSGTTSTVTGTFTKLAPRSTFVINGYISIINAVANTNGNDADFSAFLNLNNTNVGSIPFHVTAPSTTRLNIPVCYTVFPSTITPAANIPINITTSSGCALYNAILTVTEYQA